MHAKDRLRRMEGHVQTVATADAHNEHHKALQLSDVCACIVSSVRPPYVTVALHNHTLPEINVIGDHAVPGVGFGLSSLQERSQIGDHRWRNLHAIRKGGKHQKPQTHPTEQLV
jgi:hypothetical protein